MQITAKPLDGMLVIEPRVFEDERGYFLETHHYQRFQSARIDCTFVQDNLSFSRKNVLRGLHFQRTKPQAKLIQTISGGIFDMGVWRPPQWYLFRPLITPLRPNARIIQRWTAAA